MCYKPYLYCFVCTLLMLAGCERALISDTAVIEAEGKQGNPDLVILSTRDIDLFNQAYDGAVNASNSTQLFQSNYIDKASPVVQATLASGRVTGISFQQTIGRYPRFYQSVRKTALSAIQGQLQPIRQALRDLKRVYPDALFPSVYFGVGVFNNGGKSLSQGIYIGAEFYTPDAETPTDELTPYLRQVRSGPARLPTIVAHELVHQQQHYRNQNTLLADAIAEGSADFLADLATGNVATGGPTYAFGQANERAVWLRFRQDMDGAARQNWLYNGFSGNAYNFPPDMGYFVGYKICQAYYNRTSDKIAALRTMLTISDFRKFLTQSGYGDQF